MASRSQSKNPSLASLTRKTEVKDDSTRANKRGEREDIRDDDGRNKSSKGRSEKKSSRRSDDSRDSTDKRRGSKSSESRRRSKKKSKYYDDSSEYSTEESEEEATGGGTYRNKRRKDNSSKEQSEESDEDLSESEIERRLEKYKKKLGKKKDAVIITKNEPIVNVVEEIKKNQIERIEDEVVPPVQETESILPDPGNDYLYPNIVRKTKKTVAVDSGFNEDSRALIYTRVSTAFQTGPHAVSLEMQKHRCEEKAAELGITIGGYYSDEGISGKSMKNRPEFNRMDQDLKPGYVVIVYSVSRFARNASELKKKIDEYKEKGVKFCSATEAHINNTTATEQFMTQLVGLLAELEVGMTKERVEGALAFKKLRGEALGPPPYGMKYSSDRKIFVVNEDEQPAVRRIVQLSKETTSKGKPLTLNTISQKLTDEGYKPRRAVKWHHSVIRNIIEYYKEMYTSPPPRGDLTK